MMVVVLQVSGHPAVVLCVFPPRKERHSACWIGWLGWLGWLVECGPRVGRQRASLEKRDRIGRGDEQRLGVAPCAVEGVVTAERGFEEGSKFLRVLRTRRKTFRMPPSLGYGYRLWVQLIQG